MWRDQFSRTIMPPPPPNRTAQVAHATRCPPFQLKSRLKHCLASSPMYRAVSQFDDDEGNSTPNKAYGFQASGDDGEI